MSRERGSVTIWILGLAVVIIGFGGVALDYWRALGSQRQLAAIADAATIAGASGIDELHYRSTGEVLLDPDRARALVARSIDSQDEELESVTVSIYEDRSGLEVTIVGGLDAGFIGLFTGEDGRLTVSATSRASPVRLP